MNTHTVADIALAGDLLGLRLRNETEETEAIIITVDPAGCTLTVRWVGWIMRVLMWNPCNDWKLVAGVSQ